MLQIPLQADLYITRAKIVSLICLHRIYHFGDHHSSCSHPHCILLPQKEQNKGKIVYLKNKQINKYRQINPGREVPLPPENIQDFSAHVGYSLCVLTVSVRVLMLHLYCTYAEILRWPAQQAWGCSDPPKHRGGRRRVWCCAWERCSMCHPRFQSEMPFIEQRPRLNGSFVLFVQCLLGDSCCQQHVWV